ncbi:hypothetical protein D9M72_294430 [compost metagenome]
MQPPLRIAHAGHLLGQRTGAETDGPDHRRRLDAPAIGQGHAVRVHRRHAGVDYPFDAQVAGRLDDRRANPVAQGGTDLRATVDDYHLDVLVMAEHGLQARRHLGGGFDAGETATGHHHRIACGAVGPLLEGVKVVLQAHCRFDLVDIEGMGVQARHIRTHELAAGCQHQAVVVQLGLLPILVDVADGLRLFIDAIGRAHDEADAHRIEQVVQRREHPLHVRLVETRTYPQLWLGRQQGDMHVVTIALVQQASGAQSAPDSSESRTDDQNVFHGLLRRQGQVTTDVQPDR